MRATVGGARGPWAGHPLRLPAILMATLLTSGCSLLFDPDTSFFEPRDGGTDQGPRNPEVCDNDVDDDGDQLADCDDFDCEGHPHCCQGGAIVLDETWSAADLTTTWALLPSGAPALPDRETVGANTLLTSFGAGDEPKALLWRSCAPLVTGLDLRAQFSPRGDLLSCPEAGACPEFAALVLSPATDMTPGNRLLDELALTVYANGHIALTQSGQSVATFDIQPRQHVAVSIGLGPSFDARNRAIIQAQVTLTVTETTDEVVLADSWNFTLQEQLLAGNPCTEEPGLRLAIEGQGDSVHVYPLEAQSRSCVNPGHFEPPMSSDQPLRYDDLGFVPVGLPAPSFAEGAIGSPSISHAYNDIGTTTRWDLMVEGTNLDPNAALYTHVGYALGHAASTSWNTVPWSSSESPKLGDDPPGCTTESGCDALRSVRDPYLLPTLASGILSKQSLAFARELDPIVTGERGIYALHIAPMMPLSPAVPLSYDPSTLVVAPADLAGCRSLRDPAVLAAGAGYWLLYTCERASLGPRIEALRLGGDFKPVAPLDRAILLDSETQALGSYAEAGVYGAEPLLETRNGNERIWLWFIATAIGGRRTVGLARSADQIDLTNGFPAMSVYPANPILDPEHPLLGRCSDGCSLSAIAVTPRIDEPTRLRFVVARKLIDPSLGVVHELVPIEQIWSVP